MQMKTSYHSFHSFLLRSSGFKCNFIDFFSQDTLRYITKWKAGKMNQSLLHAKANKFSRNALIDSKPPAVTAHNHAFKSPFTIMSKFYHNAQRIAFFQPQVSQVAFLEPEVPAASSTDLKIRRLATATARAKQHLRG